MTPLVARRFSSSSSSTKKQPYHRIFYLSALVGFATFLKLHSASEETTEDFSLEELNKMSTILGVSLDLTGTPEEIKAKKEAFLKECCAAALAACKEEQWSQKIVPLKAPLQRLKNNFGQDLFLAAVAEGNLAVIRGLIEAKFPTSKKDNEGNNALHLASMNGHVEIIGFLSRFINIDSPNIKKLTPLHVAIMRGKAAAVDALLARNASKRIAWENEGVSLMPAALAIQYGEKDCLSILLRDDRDQFSIQTGSKGNLLHIGVLYQQREIIEYLFDHFPKETAQLLKGGNGEQMTPLHVAAGLGDIEIIELLISKGADPNARGPQERTSLHIAALAEQYDAIRWLHYLGADPKAEDADMHTPYVLIENVKSEGAEQCLSLLKQIILEDKKYRETPPDFSYRPPQYIVFRGGGPAGFAYAGALKKLHDLGKDQEIKGYAGSSAGAIVAVLAGTGHTPDEMFSLLKDRDLLDFLDASSPTHQALVDAATKGKFGFSEIKKIVGDFWNKGKLATNPIGQVKEFYNKISTMDGLCDGEEFRKWMEAQIRNKTKTDYCTFGEYRKKGFKTLKIYAVRLDKNGLSEVVCFSSDDKKCKDLVISDIIRCSMSIPGIYKPHVLHYKDPDGNRHPLPLKGYFVDAGTLENFPIRAFDGTEYQQHKEWGGAPNRRTLGIGLKQKLEIPSTQEIQGPADLLMRLAYAFWYAQEIRDKQYTYNKDRIADIDRGDVDLLKFRLSAEEKARLFKEGEDSIGFFFQPRHPKHERDTS